MPFGGSGRLMGPAVAPGPFFPPRTSTVTNGAVCAAVTAFPVQARTISREKRPSTAAEGKTSTAIS